MDTLENPYTFALPEIESRPLGWFMKPKDANVDWFNDIYTALYIRQEYQDLLAVILEWLFREGVESHPETNELQADHPVSALPMKVEETEEMHAVMDSPVSAEYPKEGIKVEEIEPDSVPLSWTDLRDIQTPPITATSPPSNPFSEEINRGPKLRRLIVTGLPGIGASTFWSAGSASLTYSAGKSAFARYILILRVIANLPTAIVYNSTFLHLYISGKRFEYPIHPDRVRKFPANTWVLVDSGTRLIGVPEELWVAAGVIIQFMSPREGRAQWMKKVFPRPVVVAMQPWSEIELIAACVFPHFLIADSVLFPSPAGQFRVQLRCQRISSSTSSSSSTEAPQETLTCTPASLGAILKNWALLSRISPPQMYEICL
jgi:hypothetical protein